MTISTPKFELFNINIDHFGEDENYIGATLTTEFGEIEILEWIGINKDTKALYIADVDTWYDTNGRDILYDAEIFGKEADDDDDGEYGEMQEKIWDEILEQLQAWFKEQSYKDVMSKCLFSEEEE